MSAADPAPAAPGAVQVHVREYGGAYIARCNGRTASATCGTITAAARAAARFFGCVDTRVRLNPVTNHTFLALREADAAGQAGYSTPADLRRAEFERLYGRE